MEIITTNLRRRTIMLTMDMTFMRFEVREMQIYFLLPYFPLDIYLNSNFQISWVQMNIMETFPITYTQTLPRPLLLVSASEYK